ncbi:hypothetical protein HYH02_010049 [Chlamydomonas schloesseri]|uniref:Uncharacterized protein n=1 Tax=Chlamydomonas schloesseri TaxID=2026947 RepID=A0A835W6H8_9CHLO|nr:hypothetical protein HYH02_010049 [Chlamydomonas schloesseri]|eukprot:KAG2441205.1 hypothetical protein HYH02_010049 [Chlamydomonas schloesseri]
MQPTQVGSPDGVLRGTPSLRPYFAQGISALPHLRLELQRVLEGPPGGWYGVQYTRESGALVVETVRLAAAAGGGEEAEAGAVKQGEAVAAGVAGGKVVGAGGDAGSGGGGSGSAGRNGGGRLRIVEARVFYEHVC